MKNKKTLLGLLLIVVMLLSTALFVSCKKEENPDTGKGEIYYLYENGELNKSNFIQLKDGKWSDDDNETGTYVVSGISITIYVEMMGEKEEYAKGTLKDGVLTLTIMGKTVVYCQEGKAPSKPSEPDNPSDPDDPSKPPEPAKPSKPDKFTVLFNANGGTFAENTSILKSEDVKKGSFVEEPVFPTRNGYVFVGWSIEKESDDLWDFVKNEVNSDVVLYAVWKSDDGHSVISSSECDINNNTLTAYIISPDGTYDLRDKFKVSDGASWRAFTSADCLQPTELTKRVADVEYGWNDVYVMVENQTTYESTVYDFKIYRAPVSSVTLLNDDTYSIYKGVDFPEVIIPSKYNGKKITSINDRAFYNCSKLTSVTIPDNVTSIGKEAFYDCSGLTGITIPDSVTSIGKSAFSGCSGLTSITIPSSVTSIGEYVFSSCSGLTSITIPDSVTSIGYYAFGGCSGLTSITIPSSVTSIGEYVFSSCSGLTSITIPDSVTSIGKSAFSSCSGLTSITIPDSVTSIGSSAFSGCSGLTNVTIGNGVTSIGQSAFYNCSGLTSVTIPNSVTSIGEYAFEDCSGLTSITIPNSVTSIGYRAFYNCSGLENIYLTDIAVWCKISGVDNLMVYCSSSIKLYLNNKLITDLVIPDGVTSIGSSAFRDCSGLTSITIPSSVTSIGNGAFYGCSGLTSVTIPNSVTSIGSSAFYRCSELTSITIPDSVTSIGQSAFYNCSKLTSVTIPNNVTSISQSTFYNCSGLTSITIPNSVTSIGKSAFSGCSGLENIYLTDVAAWCKISGLYELMSYRPNSIKLYLNNELITDLVIPDSVTSIGSSAFYRCSGLTSVTIPNSVTSIGYSAFSGCSGLESITLHFIGAQLSGDGKTHFGYIFGAYESRDNSQCVPSSLKTVIINNSSGITSIGKEAFYDCSGLTSVTIPDGVTSIGKSAFSGCSGLTSVKIPDSITSIGDSAFSGCSGLTSITIPSSVTSIGDSAFGSCSGLTSIIVASNNKKYHSDGNCLIETESKTLISACKNSVIPADGSVTSIGSSAFDGCSGLTSITIPSSVTSIGGYAFYGCTGLTSITIPNSVTTIGGCAFNSCSGLTSITIGNGVTYIGNSAFNYCHKLVEVINNSSLNIKKGSFAYGQVASGALNVKKYGSSDIVNKDGYLFYTNDGTNYLLGYVGNATDLELPANYNGNSYEIYRYAFEGCSGLTSITIPSSVTSIGIHAFEGCSGLTSIKIPSSVTSIGSTAFEGCSGLTSITIPSSVTSIGQSSFSVCSGLTSVTIPSTVTSIGYQAFYGCIGLSEIRFNGTIAQWKKISKDSDWDYKVPSSCKVICTDGETSL